MNELKINKHRHDYGTEGGYGYFQLQLKEMIAYGELVCFYFLFLFLFLVHSCFFFVFFLFIHSCFFCISFHICFFSFMFLFFKKKTEIRSLPKIQRIWKHDFANENDRSSSCKCFFLFFFFFTKHTNTIKRIFTTNINKAMNKQIHNKYKEINYA